MSRKHGLNQHIRRLERKIARFERKGRPTDGLRKELAYCTGRASRPEAPTGPRARDLHARILQRLASAHNPHELAERIARELSWSPARMERLLRRLPAASSRSRRRAPRRPGGEPQRPRASG